MKKFVIVLLVLATASLAWGAGPQTASLKDPKSLTEKAPATFNVKFDTSAGVFAVEVHRDWAPLGADRFYNLVKLGFYDNTRFFRVVPNFMVQFGLSGDPAIQRNWSDARMPDDPVKQGNTRGMITYAKCGLPNCRSTQLFINYKDNSFLNSQGFAPFGKVTSGMDVVDKINSQYAEQPQQDRISAEGNAYLTKSFPKLDYIKKAAIEK